VPFPDELALGLAVVAYDHGWPGDFAVLARRIQGALGPMAVRVSHVGSTSVPGLAAKDCIDVQARTGPTQILMIAAESRACQIQWAPHDHPALSSPPRLLACAFAR
jgi:GrpB-like predicted nucleotidyltransferase (UPF0157 family)